MAKIFEGVVVSTKMDKTIGVRVEKKYRHPMYKKVVTKHVTFLAHNEDKEIKEGDVVRIQETRPMSRSKHFKVINKTSK